MGALIYVCVCSYFPFPLLKISSPNLEHQAARPVVNWPCLLGYPLVTLYNVVSKPSVQSPHSPQDQSAFLHCTAQLVESPTCVLPSRLPYYLSATLPICKMLTSNYILFPFSLHPLWHDPIWYSHHLFPGELALLPIIHLLSLLPQEFTQPLIWSCLSFSENSPKSPCHVQCSVWLLKGQAMLFTIWSWLTF